jgi:hypothetical protein
VSLCRDKGLANATRCDTAGQPATTACYTGCYTESGRGLAVCASSPVTSRPATASRSRRPLPPSRLETGSLPVGRPRSPAAHGGARGLTLGELLDKVQASSAPISGANLRAWLVTGGLAVEHDGLLEPTKLCVALGGLLA